MPEPCEISPGKRGQSHTVRALAAEQEGVVGRTQLLARGIDRRAIDRALRSGTLHRLHPGVYSVSPPELLNEDPLLLSALFAAGLGAFLSHGTAAWRWQIIPAPPIAIEVAVPDRRRLRAGDVVTNGRFRSTPVPRTLLDLAVRLRANTPAQSARRGRVPTRRPCRRHHPHAPPRPPGQRQPPSRPRCPRSGPRRGQEPPRAPLPDAADPARHRAPDPQPSARSLRRRLRLARPALVVELDGRQHARPHQADADDDRDLWLRSHRYVPCRYGTKQLDHGSDDVIADLLAAFAEAVKLGYWTGG